MKNLIIDGNNLVHRTFWTAKATAKGDELKIDNFHVYFTLNAIKSYVDMFKPDHIYMCWDEKPDYQQNERKGMFEDYKGNRSSDLSPHRNNVRIREFLCSLGIPSLFPRQLEADDIVSYLCTTLPDQKCIISVDKDFLQLVDTNITVYDPIRKQIVTPDNFEEVAKCTKSDFVKVKCVLGDKSDNVPGIAGFGKVKLGKFLAGQIKLTQEEEEIYNRNHELFRLDRWKDASCQDEAVYYEQQLEGSVLPMPCYKTFIDMCKDAAMWSIFHKKEVWYSTFFAKSKMQSLFS